MSGHPNETATQRLATVLLGQDVLDFIAERRTAGVAWRYICRQLAEATDGQIDVTHETLRQWESNGKARNAS
jgi:uncharacterized Ntn-hydrolase superfamily protein